MRIRFLIILLSLTAALTAQQAPEAYTLKDGGLLAPVSQLYTTPLEESGIEATFTWQASQFGNLQLYAANVCNRTPMNATVQSYRDVWPAAKAVHLQLQTPTAIREVQRRMEKTNIPKWIMWGIAGGCAIASGVTSSGVVANNPNETVGKIVAYSTAGCAIGFPILAERTAGRPGGEEVPVTEVEMLPATFVLAAGDCKQGLVYAIPAFQTKVLNP